MAVSPAMNTSNQYVKYNITITQNWQSIPENCTNVNVKVTFWRTNQSYTTYGTGTIYCKIDGTTYSASVSSSQKITSSGIVLFNKDITIYHSDEGSKRLDTSAWINISTPLTSSEQWYSENLTTIPRTSEISVNNSSPYFGDTISIHASRKSNQFWHAAYYKIGDQSLQLINGGFNEDCTWTIPKDFAQKTPNSNSLPIIIAVDTMVDSSTKIGQKSVNITANIPDTDEFYPKLNTINIQEGTAGLFSKFGAYIQNKSSFKVDFSALGVYGSTIKRYEATANSQSFTSNSFTTSSLTLSGNNEIKVKFYDSRGRGRAVTRTATVLSYSEPFIGVFTAQRCNSSGVLDDKGDCVKCEFSANITALNNRNDRRFTIKWKATDTETYQTYTISTSSYSVNSTKIFNNINVDKEYTFIFEVQDYFSTSSKTARVPTAFTLMDFNKSGTAIAFGKVSTISNGFEVDLPAVFNKTINGENLKFEHGYWTPELYLTNGNRPNHSVIYRSAMYKRISNLCYITFRGKWTIYDKGNGYACIRGLPYASWGSGGYSQTIAVREISGAFQNGNVDRTFCIYDYSTTIEIFGENGAWSLQFQNGDVWIAGSGFYMIHT